MPVCQVAIPTPVPRLFDYLLPDEMAAPACGVRVAVPFGRKRGVIGVVVRVSSASAVPPGRLRVVDKVLDPEPLLPVDVLNLLSWAAEYYHHPIGDVISAALPTRLRQGAAADLPGVQAWRVTSAGAAAEPRELRAPVQRRLLTALQAVPEHGLTQEALGSVAKRWRPAVRGLIDRGLVGAYLADAVEDMIAPPGGEAHTLNAAQARAVAAINQARGFQPFLLRGVTGSGKTEVYLQAIEHLLSSGQSALVLVPEIGLTPQLIERFRARLGVPLAVLHSGLSETKRAAAWLRARAGKARIVLGTRSAIFTPIPRLGLIVVDEEHDPSYKQQDGFRYSARDLAVMRASRAGIPIVLGSATPSLESLNQARSGHYAMLELPERAATATLPPVELLDMRRLAVEDGLSHPLRVALDKCLMRGEQSLLFLNRRGFAPIWMCLDCGFVVPCTRCDARLTYHRARARLVCHHCGIESALPTSCPTCKSERSRAVGEGTERVEAALKHHFPGARILRIDRDTTRRMGALEAQLASVHAGKADILVGTQMLSKGHDFPNVTLVGVLNADQGLFSADFRGPERLFQQIVQVSGRAGRASRPGTVLIQTYHPEHPLFAALRAHDYMDFASYALTERREAGYPPFGYLALLRAESPKAGTPLVFLRYARELAHNLLPATVALMEPVAAPMERRAGRYRAQLLVQASARKPLHVFLAEWLALIWQSKEAKRVRWSLDVDPIDLY